MTLRSVIFYRVDNIKFGQIKQQCVGIDRQNCQNHTEYNNNNNEWCRQAISRLTPLDVINCNGKLCKCVRIKIGKKRNLNKCRLASLAIRTSSVMFV